MQNMVAAFEKWLWSCWTVIPRNLGVWRGTSVQPRSRVSSTPVPARALGQYLHKMSLHLDLELRLSPPVPLNFHTIKTTSPLGRTGFRFHITSIHLEQAVPSSLRTEFSRASCCEDTLSRTVN